MIKKVLLVIFAAFVILQFFQIDKENPTADPSLDFMTMYSPSTEVAEILKTACYDCHSFKTKYPWYTYTQPLGWWIEGHIDHGRGELNFSEFGNYSPKRADHKLEEGIEFVEEKEMPLPSYLYAHWDADLTDTERETLVTWFKEIRTDIKEANKESHEEESEHEKNEDDHEQDEDGEPD